VDLREDPRWIQPGSLLQSQNFIPYQGYVAVKRKGSELLNTTAWASVNRAVFGMRYCVNSATRYKLACLNINAGDEIVSINDTTGAVTLLTGMPARAGNSRWRGIVAGEVPTAYFGDGLQGLLYTTDGVNIAEVTGTQVPSKGYPAGPYFDRILCFDGKRVYYPQTNATPLAAPMRWDNPDTGNPQYLFVNHTEEITAVFTPGPDKTEVGYSGRLYICTPTSAWSHFLDFDGTAGVASSKFYKVHERAGIAGRNCWDWTDQGVAGMGTDDVWVFPIAGTPFAIGGPIKSVIEAIPAAYREKCSVVFYSPFLIVSYVRSGMTYADREYWADLSGYNTKLFNYGITWHGPMVRSTSGIECFFQQPQQPDEYELFGLLSTSAQIATLEVENVYTDLGGAMESILETADLDGNTRGNKTCNGYILGAYVSQDEDIPVMVKMDEGADSATETLSLIASGGRFDSGVWSSAVWGGARYILTHGYFTSRPTGSKGRLEVHHTGANPFAIKEASLVMGVHGRV